MSSIPLRAGTLKFKHEHRMRREERNGEVPVGLFGDLFCASTGGLQNRLQESGPQRCGFTRAGRFRCPGTRRWRRDGISRFPAAL